MHILLTDVLTCPRCGPAFGLILLADEVSSRRVQSGRLGCANCREQYAVSDGVVLVGPGVGTSDENEGESVAGGGGDASQRLAALVGVTEGPAYLLVVGPASVHAPAMAALVENVEVVVVNGVRTGEGSTGDGGVSHVQVSGRRLPLGSGRMAGVVLSGPHTAEWLEEGVRVLGPLGRLVVESYPESVRERLSALGLQVLAEDAATLVAGRRHR